MNDSRRRGTIAFVSPEALERLVGVGVSQYCADAAAGFLNNFRDGPFEDEETFGSFCGRAPLPSRLDLAIRQDKPTMENLAGLRPMQRVFSSRRAKVLK